MLMGAHWDPGTQGAPLALGWGEAELGGTPRFLTVLFPSCSGVIGSGLCVFSRFPILDTLLYQYSLNGYPYMVSGVGGGAQHHGAWPHGTSPALTRSPSPLAAPAWGLVLRQVRRPCGH